MPSRHWKDIERENVACQQYKQAVLTGLLAGDVINMKVMHEQAKANNMQVQEFVAGYCGAFADAMIKEDQDWLQSTK